MAPGVEGSSPFTHPLLLSFLLLVSLLPAAGCHRPEPARRPPSILFIVLDDLGARAGYLGTKGVSTPNLDRLAARSVVFERAYAPAPLCNPSRTAVIFGLAPWTTGIASNHERASGAPALESARSLFDRFHRAGWETALAGKVFHEMPDESSLARTWDHVEGAGGDYGPFPTTRRIPADIATDDHVRGCYDFEEWSGPDSDFPDVVNVDRAITHLRRPTERPLFLALGLVRPHCPWTAPKRFFDRYPLGSVPSFATGDADLDDLPPAGRRHAIGVTSDAKIREVGVGPTLVRAYLASLSFMDWNLGRLLDALDDGPRAAETIVVLWSDQGFDLGEKRHWGKNALWETTTRVPLLISVPGKTRGERTTMPVSLLDLHPTLLELAGLPSPAQTLDGESLRRLLDDPRATWDRAVVTSQRNKSFAVRDRRWRYIRYKNGDEELYDHDSDPAERRNLAGDPSLAAIKGRLAAAIPRAR